MRKNLGQLIVGDVAEIFRFQPLIIPFACLEVGIALNLAGIR